MKQSKRLIWPFAVSMALAGEGPAAAPNFQELPLTAQSRSLPSDFKDHFFDVPLAMRVEIDGQFLSDAMGVLTEAGRVQLIEWMRESGDSPQDATRWLQFLREPRALGACGGDCGDVVALHYNLQTSTLSIVTAQAERAGTVDRYHRLPDGGSRGLLLRNALNVAGGERQSLAARYTVDAIGSVGQWTGIGTVLGSQSALADGERRHLVSRLYLQRETHGHFIRAGFFVPDYQGRLRAPRAPDAFPDTTAGVMVGTSEALEIAQASPSMAPLHVTANRQGVVEVFRDGLLLYTQPVEAGLQTINTTSLPAGVYEVEVRLVEDGQLSSTRTELIYKPTTWGDTGRRWRYALFGGQERAVFGKSGRDADDLTAGGAVNYLAHPQLVLGASIQQTGDRRTAGASADWSVTDGATLFISGFHSSERGFGFDLQSMLLYRGGSLTVSHNEAREAPSRLLAASSRERQASSSIAWSHQWSTRTQLSGYLTHTEGRTRGAGIDLGLTHQRKLFGSDAHLRFSAFDRPLGTLGRRDRGLNLTLTMALGDSRRSYSMSAGTRSDAQGGRDHHASLGVRQSLDHPALRQVGLTASMDRHGLGLNGTALLRHELVEGDLFAQRSSLNGAWSGGANLNSAVAIGAGGVAVSGDQQAAWADAGMIIDVDTDLPEASLWAQDVHGAGLQLHAGRNFVPVTAYRAGKLHLEFDAVAAPSAVVQPSLLPYHLNKGGVDHQTVRVLKTVTVIGRLVDHQQQPIRGGRVTNHAGHAVTEADGLFALEMSERNPQLVVKHADLGECLAELVPERAQREGDVLLLGDVSCLVEAERPPEEQAPTRAAALRGRSPL